MRKRNPTLTQIELRNILDYAPETGCFTWRKSPSDKIRVGQIAGGRHCQGYTSITFLGQKYLAHRLAWLYCFGVWPKDQIDHINGVKTDNRIKNLREATAVENGRNMRLPKDNTSGYKGVYRDRTRRKWLAHIRVNGVMKNLGRFTDIEAAANAYAKAARENFGEFARLT